MHEEIPLLEAQSPLDPPRGECWVKLLAAAGGPTLQRPLPAGAPSLQEPSAGWGRTGRRGAAGGDLAAGGIVHGASGRARESTLGLGKMTPFSSVSLHHPLLAESNTGPAGQGEIFQGPSSIFTEQKMKDE